MPTPKPYAATIYPWLRANLGPRALAPLTGTDASALKAAVHIVDLWTHNRSSTDVAAAFGKVISQMQPHTQELAYHAIAHVCEWSDRQMLWMMAFLPPIENPRICAFEPGGTGGEAK